MDNGDPKNDLPYRPCVGIALFNKDGQVFVGERVDNPGAWQMPQGGIDQGEDISAAAFRELKEETGTSKAEIIEILATTLCYDLPSHLQGKLWKGKYRGQEQHWVAMRFTGQNGDINLDPGFEKAEFLRWQWIDIDKVLDVIVPFKVNVYKSVVQAFSKYANPDTHVKASGA